jgi:hypothetical protein
MGTRAEGNGSAFQAEQGPGADCLQRPLVPRSRFRQQVSPSVRLLGNQGYHMSSQYENVVKGGTHGNTDHYHSCQP